MQTKKIIRDIKKLNKDYIYNKIRFVGCYSEELDEFYKEYLYFLSVYYENRKILTVDMYDYQDALIYAQGFADCFLKALNNEDCIRKKKRIRIY